MLAIAALFTLLTNVLFNVTDVFYTIYINLLQFIFA